MIDVLLYLGHSRAPSALQIITRKIQTQRNKKIQRDTNTKKSKYRFKHLFLRIFKSDAARLAAGHLGHHQHPQVQGHRQGRRQEDQVCGGAPGSQESQHHGEDHRPECLL